MQLKKYVPPAVSVPLAKGRDTAINFSWSVVPLQIGSRPDIFVLGNQKSGTTVIAALLAQSLNSKVQLDILSMEAAHQIGLANGSMRLSNYIRKRRKPFLLPIVKEPGLTFLYPQLKALYPAATFIMIVRDPRDNIRSILNRLKLPGDRDVVTDDELKRVNDIWKMIVLGTQFGPKSYGYIKNLAERWNAATNVYFNDVENLHLLTYESFVADKAGRIESLVRAIGREPIKPIDDLVDKQFQSKGKAVNWQAFFGADNLRLIERICQRNMQQLGYRIQGG